MQNDWSQQKESVAHHEAGHRVVAASEKAPPVDVHLRRSEGVWKGAVLGYPKLLGDARIRIAYAGPLAEIKYQARRQIDPAAVFDIANQPRGWIEYLQNPESEDYETLTEDFPINFIVGKEQKTLPIDIGVFSDDDLIAFNLAKRDASVIRGQLLKTIEQLDQTKVWLAVETLAQELLVRLGDAEAVTLRADIGEKIIRGVL